jgi:hypothetical protein
MRITCQAADCDLAPERLPEALDFLDVEFCEGHQARLLEIAKQASDISPEASYMQQVVLREAQTLLYPPEEGSSLRALAGGGG